jgi:hypothetical protein
MVHLRSKVRGTPRNAYRNIESACSPILAVVLASPRMLLSGSHTSQLMHSSVISRATTTNPHAGRAGDAS